MYKDSLVEILSRNVKYYRFVRGLTQEELAEKSNLSTRSISDIENANNNTSIYALEAISHALEVDASLLIYNHPHIKLPKKVNMKYKN